MGWARGVANCGLTGRPLQRGSEGAVSRQGHQQERQRSEISRHSLKRSALTGLSVNGRDARMPI